MALLPAALLVVCEPMLCFASSAAAWPVGERRSGYCAATDAGDPGSCQTSRQGSWMAEANNITSLDDCAAASAAILLARHGVALALGLALAHGSRLIEIAEAGERVK